MNVSGPDPSGALNKLFLPIQHKEGLAHDPRTGQSASRSGTHDAVVLSGFAQDARNLATQAAQLPDIRGERLQQVQAALDRQEPLASSRQVADALVRDTILNSLSSA